MNPLSKNRRRNEKGIALFFSLILLSLLLILALAFALNSMFEEKAAYNSANVSAAAILAKTQLAQVLSLIQNDEASLTNSSFYSRDAGNPVVTHNDFLKDMLAERLPVKYILDTVDTNKVNWNYIRSKDTVNRIIGRTAFVVVAEGAPLDSLVDERVGEAEYPKINEELAREQRIGKYVSEINVRSAIPNVTSNIDLITRTLNWAEDKPVVGAGFTDGLYTGDWTDYNNLFSTLKTVIGVELPDADKKEIRNNLSLNVFKDKEAFWIDTLPAGAADEIISSNELYKRFDLTRNWDKADWAEDLAFIKNNILLTSGTAPNLDMDTWNEIDSGDNSKGLPWLACFGYQANGSAEAATVQGTFGSIEDRRFQIAANLKDYCDTDSRPSSDVDPALWVSGATIPKYTGNEKTPYIDKVGVRVEVMRNETSDYTDTSVSPAVEYYKISATINIYPCAGLINIYGPDCADDLEVTVEGTVVIETIVNGISLQKPYNFTKTVKIFSSDWSTTGYSDLELGSYEELLLLNEQSTTDKSITVTVKEVNITKAVLHAESSPATAYDCAANLTNVLATPLTLFTGSGDTVEYGWFGFAVHDPRQNLNGTNGTDPDWLVLASMDTDDPSSVFSLDAGANRPGAANYLGPTPTISPATINADYDLETNSDPANNQLSTAFIRNRPMESPWELGFVHRGKMWQTLNLTAYDATKAYKAIDIGGKKYLAGGGTYASGDANILDQIKMTPKAYSQQKISLLTQRADTLDALLKHIRYGCDIDSDMRVRSIAGVNPADGIAFGGNTELSDVEIATIRDNIIAKYKTVANPELRRTRASVVDMLQIAALSNNAEQEEIIGKVVNLTKIEGKVVNFTVIVLAQTIKDIGSATGFTVNKFSLDESRQASRNCVISQFDADVDLATPGRSIYFDEITAERKIIVRGYRAVDGTIKISSFNYVD